MPKNQLRDEGFEQITIEFQERQDIPANQIFQQDPRAGLLLAEPNDPDNPIRLFASKGSQLCESRQSKEWISSKPKRILLSADFSVERVDEQRTILLET